MRLEQLYYFEKIYEEKSMSKAAEKLFVLQLQIWKKNLACSCLSDSAKG